jgi:hypothetical protein
VPIPEEAPVMQQVPSIVYSFAKVLSVSRADVVCHAVATMLGGVPDTRFAVPAAIEFAFQAPFVNYWRAMVEMSTPGLVFSKMLSVQQNGMTARARSHS